MHPATQELLDNFTLESLPDGLDRSILASIVYDFEQLANKTAARAEGAETTAALRKLLEARDCAVRAVANARKKWLKEQAVRDAGK